MVAGHRVVLWFRNDLRLTDNAAVQQAASMVKKGQASEVVPLYCFDPRNFIATPCGNPKTGAYRAQFLIESVTDLKKSLQQIGSDLMVRLGTPEEAVQGLIQEGQPLTVIAHLEVAKEEQDVDAGVKRTLGNQGRLQTVWGNTLYEKDDLPFSPDMSDLPDVFTPFRNKAEQKCQIPRPVPRLEKGTLPLPNSLPKERLEQQPSRVEDLNSIVPEGAPKLSTPQPNSKAAIAFKGGETAALQRLKHYLWDTGCISDYFNTRNGMLGPDYSTKFSPWLAHGCISPRTIHHEVKRYEEQHGSNKSTYWVTFELMWRDFFRFFTVKHGTRIFFESGTSGKKLPWSYDEQLFKRWRDGKTGMPLVDANMREIKQTGFMSNRGRQNVASYLALDLGIDWRMGADWFESVLVDYDVYSNWGNWVSAAGMTGGRISHFNITKQSKDYDEQGDYIRTWVPELAKVPAPSLFEPWRLSRADQDKCGVQIGVDYPEPSKSRYSTEGFQRDDHRDGGRGGRGRGRGRGRGGSGKRGEYSRHGGANKQKRGGSDFERFG
ncbi:g3993 [Coccomyxa viridis]|uniref:Cryptochrome DASH n=1 Tax=Coccomyxa viridis TaxID=1274662 RepID=A0ABP1FU67_9CHLO